jgi:hypothetical protein
VRFITVNRAEDILPAILATGVSEDELAAETVTEKF